MEKSTSTSTSTSTSNSISKSKHKREEERNLQKQGEKRPRGEDEEVEATLDEEVEEFYAILRRMHAAQRIMSMLKENPTSKSTKVEDNRKMMKRKATFQSKNFRQREGGSEIVVKSDPIDGGKKVGERKGFGFLDLNADPDPEITAVLG